MTAGLSTTERAALVLLGSLGRQTGAQLVAASAGMLARGTVYLALAALMDRGWVEMREAHVVVDETPVPTPHGPAFLMGRANVYLLTTVGRLELELLHEAWGRSAA